MADVSGEWVWGRLKMGWMYHVCHEDGLGQQKDDGGGCMTMPKI